MLVAVIGGKLQGIEATYLAHKTGWEVLLIDTNPAVPASGLCDFFVPMDITDEGWLDPVLKDVDLIIPATENRKVLNTLSKGCRDAAIPFAYDAHAYAISSSKLKSNRLFDRIGVPVPVPWPDCGFPAAAKPSSGSGSKGVQIFYNQQQLEKRFPSSLPPKNWVLQEYVEGPSYSLEVVGTPGHYTALQVTDLEMDAGYDCKRVLAPTLLSPERVTQFKKISIKIAEAIQLNGLMDVEVILHNNELKVLEIDARLPSQTPTVVYWSSGCNILEFLALVKNGNKWFENSRMKWPCKSKIFDPLFIKSGWHPQPKMPPNQLTKLETAKKFGLFERLCRVLIKNRPPEAIIEKKGIIYEHIKVSPGAIKVCGEHIMARAGPLHLFKDFYGADEVITNYSLGRSEWVATLIITGADRREAWEKRNRVIRDIQKHFKLDTYKDPSPPVQNERGDIHPGHHFQGIKKECGAKAEE